MAITTELVRRIQREPPSKVQEYRDKEVMGFVLRARPSGAHSWRVRLANHKWLSLGLLKDVPLAKARDAARNARARSALGQTPRETTVPTLRVFLSTSYEPWVLAYRKTGGETLARIRSVFAHLMDEPLDAISIAGVEKWRTQRRKTGRSPETAMRDLNALRATLSKAVAWKVLTTHPLADLRPERTDKRRIVRYLDEGEEKALRDALAARDAAMRAERERANVWRKARGYPEWPLVSSYGDHLTPLVILAMNTGLRRGELFQLHWSAANPKRSLLTVHGESAKSGQTRHVPLNSEAADTLAAWKPADAQPNGYVFPGAVAGQSLTDVKTAWHALMKRAAIVGFRFHDLRHHFASKLVMAGVDLNTVRELLGHSDIKMVLRYAHLAPENLAEAVAKLNPPTPPASSSPS